MIILDTNTRSLEVILAGAKQTTDSPWMASYEDVPTARPQKGQALTNASTNNGVTNGATAVTIVPASGTAGTTETRQIKSFSLANDDSAIITLTIQLNDNGTLRKVFGPVVLDVNESITYEAGQGWSLYDVSGSMKYTPDSATSTATSKAFSQILLVSKASSAASLAMTVATSDGLQASTASSAASLANSLGTSDGLSASVASSAASLAKTVATSAGVSASVASSAASLADSKGSNAQSRALSSGW